MHTYSMPDSLYHNLNPRQKQSALHHEGPLLIIAGAGTGKTKTLVHRIASLIESGVPPENILAVTFTNKAAAEMRERVDAVLGSAPSFNRPVTDRSHPFVSTFHSLGVFLLRGHYAEMDLPKHFSICDRDRSKQLLREAARRSGLDPKQYDIGKTLGLISNQKNALVSAEEFSSGDSYVADLVGPIWRAYEEHKKEEGAVDFDDLLVLPIRLLEDRPDIRKRYRTLWRYVHIDEYQDTNEAQCRLMHLLASEHKNICAVADADQTIYSWRGARVETVLNFEHDYPGARTILLEENYRSTKTILEAANTVISKNRKRTEKKLYTENAEGEKIELISAFSENEEASRVAQKTAEILSGGVPASEVAVLYRTNFQSRALEEAFLAQNIPYTVVGTKFLDRQEVRDVLAYIEGSRNRNAWSSIKRIINLPPRGIGKTTLLRVLEGAESKLSRRAQDSLTAFYRLLDDIEKKVGSERPSELVKFVIEHSGLDRYYKERNEEERLENMRELVTLAARYDSEGVNHFLERTALAADQDSLTYAPERSVKLMTVHAAKGLEFDHVFITGLEEGLFPHDPVNDEPRDEEEERRLFYVALTRARKKAVLSTAQTRTIFGSTSVQLPSQFIADIENLVPDRPPHEDSGGEGGLLSRPPLPPIQF